MREQFRRIRQELEKGRGGIQVNGLAEFGGRGDEISRDEILGERNSGDRNSRSGGGGGGGVAVAGR